MIKEQLKAENIQAKFDMPTNEPTYKKIEDKDGNVLDYLDVKIDGYANTFTLDRGGDLCLRGCFVEHLGEYNENPILLLDHNRDTKSAIGRVFSAYEDDKGLKVSAVLSNAPDARDIRFKVAEGILKTFSIGGLFHVKQGKDINYIDKVELREISIVTVPMNQKSLFEVKTDANDVEKKLEESRAAEKMARDNQQDDQLNKTSAVYINVNGKKYKYKGQSND